MLKYFENVRLVRMADGKTYKLIRDLGLVKGGKGLRCHEAIMTFQFKLKPVSIHVPLSELISMLSVAVARRSAA
ncbi:MAG: hypothetical protein Q7V17_21660 [Afipia sp.]|jgi:hypothetical protein|nr:hypothetical protein [Afipia sp.]MDZ4367749.1 hypothetical protein [Afipia sp.]